MDDKDLIMAIGELKGNVKATHKAIVLEFSRVGKKLDDHIKENKNQNDNILKMVSKQEKRIVNLETERKVAAKAGAIYGTISGILTVGVVKIGHIVVSVFSR